MAESEEEIEAGWRDLDSKVDDAITELGVLIKDAEKQKEEMEVYCTPHILRLVLAGLQVKNDGSHTLGALSAILPLAKYFEDAVVPWADSFLKEISTDIGVDRSFLKEQPIQRESTLGRLLLITNLFEGYIFIVMWTLHNFKGHLPYKDVATLLAPLSIQFRAMDVIEKNLPTEKDISDMNSSTIPIYTKTENMLTTFILFDLVASIRDVSLIHQSPATLEHQHKLLKRTNTDYADHSNIFKTLCIVAKALSLSEPLGTFDIADYAISPWCAGTAFTSVWYNFPRALNTAFELYEVLKHADIYLFMERLFATKEITTSFFKIITRSISEDLLDLERTGADPKSLKEVTRHVATAMSRIYIQLTLLPDLFTSQSDKATLKYLADEAVEKNIAMYCYDIYLSAVLDEESDEEGDVYDRILPPELRMQLFWACLNILSIYGTAFILHHKRESYLSSAVLEICSSIAKCFSAIMHDYPKISDEEEKKSWIRFRFASLSTWPAVFINAILFQYETDQQVDREDGDMSAVLSPFDIKMTTTFAKELDINHLFDAVESCCEMGATIPFLLTLIDDFQYGLQVTRVHMVVSTLLQRLMVTIGNDISKQYGLMLHVPRAINIAMDAMKMVRAGNGIPMSVLENLFEKAAPNLAEIPDAHAHKLELVFSAFKVVNVLDLFTSTVGNKISFECPPTSEKNYTAMALVIIHTVQSLPEEVVSHPQFIEFLTQSIGRLRVSKTLSTVVLPGDVPGIERICALAEEDYRESALHLHLQAESAARGNSLQELSKAVQMESRLHHKNTLNRLLNEAKNASATDAGRAVNRSEVFAVLPCAYVGCTTFPRPGEDEIDNKKCGSCKCVRYCSAKCQKKDWKVHKIACKAVAAAGR